MNNNFSNPIDKNEFTRIVSNIKTPASFNINYVYELYELANEGIDLLSKANNGVNFKVINQYELIYYCVGEYIYSTSIKNKKELEEFLANEEYQASMASVIADKYLSLSIFNHVEKKITSRFLPPASSLNIYFNFMLNIVQGYKKNDPKASLISDLLMKSLSISRCILQLLIDGYETEAFSSWRTLHECECTLILLDRYGDQLIDKYIKHMNFGLAFNGAIKDEEIKNKWFYTMKDEMKNYGLKSKDIKKYIEYGWLYDIPDAMSDETFKLNFRDGLEKLAGLSAYAKRYELSSEIIHSTPLLIYSNKQYFYYLTLLSLYESFFRLEKVFVSLFSKRVSQTQMKQYTEMRKIYFSQLVVIHKREAEAFKRMQENKK